MAKTQEARTKADRKDLVKRPPGRLKNEKHEKYAVLVGTEFLPQGTALKEAGYAPDTIRARGVHWLDDNEDVQMRIEEIRRETVSKEIVEAMARPLSRIPELMDLSLTVLEDILRGKPVMIAGKKTVPSPATKLRAAAILMSTGNSLLVAAMPRDARTKKVSIYKIMKRHGLVGGEDEDDG
jgi:hypothetical protein